MFYVDIQGSSCAVEWNGEQYHGLTVHIHTLKYHAMAYVGEHYDQYGL